MNDRIVCAIHEEVFEHIKGDISHMKETQGKIWDQINTFKDALNKAVWKILIWVTLLLGGAAISLIIFIVTQLPRIAAP